MFELTNKAPAVRVDWMYHVNVERLLDSPVDLPSLRQLMRTEHRRPSLGEGVDDASSIAAFDIAGRRP